MLSWLFAIHRGLAEKTVQHERPTPGLRPVTVPARDGYPLGGALHEPGSPPVGLVLVGAATAIPARYYDPFAAALALQGFAALTYDYRGIGRSKAASLRGFGATIQDWIDLDAEGVIDWAVATYPHLPLVAVGHSLGGHAIGLCEGSRHLTAGVTVCSNAAWLGFIADARERLRVSALFNVVGPALTAALGYAPTSWFGFSEDLPGPVMRQWRVWVNSRRYFFDDPTVAAEARFARVEAPILLIGVDDDPWASAASIDLLASFFTNAPRERWQIPASGPGGRRIGHAGYFRQEHREALWHQLIRWLNRITNPMPNVEERVATDATTPH